MIKKIGLLGAFGLSMILTTGCSTVQRMTNSDHMSEKERDAIREKQEQEADDQVAQAHQMLRERREYLRDLKPNLTKAEVIDHLGNPHSVEFVNGQYVLFFDDQETPMTLTFDKQALLVGWQMDKETVRFREIQREAAEQKEEQREEERRERRRQAIMAVGQSFQQNKQVNCTSTRSGNQTYTNCN